MRRILMSFAVASVLAGCGDPLQTVPKLQDVDVKEGTGQVDALADPVNAAIRADLEQRPAPTLDSDKKPKGGLLGFLGRRAEAAKRAAVDETPVDQGAEDLPDLSAQSAEPEADNIQLAALAPEAETTPEIAPEIAPEAAPDAAAPKKRGLFGLGGGGVGANTDKPKRRKASRGPKPGDADYQQVSLGTSLPYGQIARICDVPKSKLGSKAGKWPERGQGFTLYDSAPGSTGQRSFYLTGFDDGCARVFTAALVLFASPETYEAIHYGTARKAVSTSTTDDAYERVKSRICRVGKGKPCGRKMNQLAKTTVFLTVYERFGNSPRWKNFLLHDGQLEAMDIKS